MKCLKKLKLSKFTTIDKAVVEFDIPMGSILVVKQGEFVSEKQLLAELARNVNKKDFFKTKTSTFLQYII